VELWLIRDTILVVLTYRSISIVAIAVLAGGLLVQAQAADGAQGASLRYSILMNGKSAGSEVDTFLPGGKIDSAFEFNDRGRGPKTLTHYTVGADGLPVSTEITGNDYLKAPVNERFSVAGGVATWKSTSEEGSAKAVAKPGTGPGGFYISNNGSLVEMAMLVGALSKAKGGAVALLPAGQARLEKLADVTLDGAGDNAGKKLHVTEYAVTGLSTAPSTVWLDDELRLFGSPGPWFALLREGWEAANDQLYALSLKAEDARLKDIASRLARHPKGAVAIEHVRLFDAENAKILPDETVVFEGGKITAVGPAATVKVPAGAEKIDGHGKTLLPGLYDMHVHIGSLDGLLNIASGVTSVRDMGNSIDEVKRLEGQWDAGTAIGPRVNKAGLIDGPGPFQSPTGLYADTPEQALAEVNRYADLGYVQIKLYSSLKPELVPGIIAAAHARGLRVSGHIPNGIIASEFVTEGADELQHINFVFLNFLGDKVKDTRTPERFTAVGEYAGTLDLSSPAVNDFIALLRSHHTTVDVTLATFESMFTGRPKVASSDMAPILKRLPAQLQRSPYGGGLPVTEANDQTYRDSYAAFLKMTKRMYDAGVPILAGTDAMAGVMLHRELELEVQAGIPAAKSLQIATWNAAGVLKQQDKLGSIGVGKAADMVLVEGNPAERISDVRRTRLVVKDGVMYEAADVYAAVGILAAP
jgi:hypothetical protein